MIVPIILSGGSGTRLWPLSRKHYPKQFISLTNQRSLFQDTILRLPGEMEEPTIICNESHRFLVVEQLLQIGKKSNNIILEPIGKNTAPAITLAALKLTMNKQDPVLFVLPADHSIQNKEAFHESIKIAETLAKQKKLVTFGVLPTQPETGYGYIEVDNIKTDKYYNINSFREKPTKKNAKKYQESTNYYWNSGMFMFKASVYLDELEKFEPKILDACKKCFQNEHKDLDFIRLNNEEFFQCPEKSIDYAIMEHTKNSVVVPLEADWIDVGSWTALSKLKIKDSKGNAIKGDVLLEEVQDTFIYGSKRLISVMGISDLLIIDTPDAILVAHKNFAQSINNIVAKLEKNNRSEVDNHRKVFRPWGYYDLIDSGKSFQVKRIMVNPKAKLSLQKHKYRSEHWVVVKGVAMVTCAEKVFELNENQSTYIPQGAVHRLGNNGATPLEIIEIQTGSYLGEDDIIRLEDDYERK